MDQIASQAIYVYITKKKKKKLGNKFLSKSSINLLQANLRSVHLKFVGMDSILSPLGTYVGARV